MPGSWILTAGLGGMGGAQPLAATMAGASLLAIECRAVAHRDAAADAAISTCRPTDLDEALGDDRARRATKRKPSRSALLGNAAEMLPELVRRGVSPDVVTDQTSAHDPLNGYLPEGLERGRMGSAARRDPERRRARGESIHRRSMCERCWISCAAGVPTLDYGNNIRQVAKDEGVDERLRLSRLRAGLYPAAVLPRHRTVPLGRAVGRSGGHLHRPTQGEGTASRTTRICTTGWTWRGSASSSRACPRASAGSGLATGTALGLMFNEMVAQGELKAPIVIGRDHLDSGSVASRQPRDRSMQDGSDAVSDWPLLNALLNCASGATWVSLHHGGGVGMGFSQHAGMVIVCDGTAEAARRIERVLWNDPASGVMRHADAGYDIAIDCAASTG